MYYYLWIFFIFGFLGWCAEVVYAAFKEKRFVNRGFLNGSICPIYGVGMVLIDFLLKPFVDFLPAMLIGCMLLGTGLEWLTNFALEKIFKQKWWDYSDQPHNLNGYICLKFALLWAVAGTASELFLVPLARRLVSYMNRTLGWVLLIVLLSIFFADLIVTVVSIIGLNSRLRNIEDIKTKMEEDSPKLDESESMRSHEQSAELKKRYSKYTDVNILYRRLIRAFPNLRSLKHNEALEEVRKNLNVLSQRSTEKIKKRNEAAAAAYEDRLPKGAERPFAYGICFTKLFWVFFLGSFIGCIVETAFAFVRYRSFEVRTSVVLGPFVLIYGLGAVLFTLILRKLYNQSDMLIILSSMVIGAVFEYLCSLFQQMIFGTVSWDYSSKSLGIGGRTSIVYSFFWGILGVVWIKDLYPMISRMIERIPKKWGRPLTAVAAVYMAVNIIISAGAMFRSNQRINDIPATNPVQEFFDRFYPDETMNFFYPNMKYVGPLDLPKPGAGDESAVSGSAQNP